LEKPLRLSAEAAMFCFFRDSMAESFLLHPAAITRRKIAISNNSDLEV
jgi:hypothetical protein